MYSSSMLSIFVFIYDSNTSSSYPGHDSTVNFVLLSWFMQPLIVARIPTVAINAIIFFIFSSWLTFSIL